MSKFITIDFETANEERSSICSVGLAWVEDGKIVKSREILVKPEPCRFSGFNTSIHGITAEDVKNAPTIKELWSELSSELKGQIVVAHYTAFDMNVLRDAIKKNALNPIEFQFICSMISARAITKNEFFSYSLDSVCTEFNIDINNHHNAEADAIACAEVMLFLCRKTGVNDVLELVKAHNVNIGEFKIGDDFVSCHKRRIYNKIKVDDIIADNVDFDESNFFYGKTVLFTGKLDRMERTEAQQMVVNLGGTLAKSMTKDVNVLVVGGFIYGDDFKSSKLKKAEQLKAQGNDIEVLTERDFLVYAVSSK